jgi:hypothetical protein
MDEAIVVGNYAKRARRASPAPDAASAALSAAYAQSGHCCGPATAAAISAGRGLFVRARGLPTGRKQRGVGSATAFDRRTRRAQTGCCELARVDTFDGKDQLYLFRLEVRMVQGMGRMQIEVRSC